MVGRKERNRVGNMLDSVYATLNAKGLEVKQLGLMRLLVWLIPSMVLLTSGMPYTVFASPDPGREMTMFLPL
jgi:hypothetical protein